MSALALNERSGTASDVRSEFSGGGRPSAAAAEAVVMVERERRRESIERCLVVVCIVS